MLSHLRNLNLLVLVIFVHFGVSSLQVPFKLSTHKQDYASAEALGEEDNSNLIFESLHAMLKTWPHAFAPNGHAAVPATIRPGTLLYHSGLDPFGTDWMAYVCNSHIHLSFWANILSFDRFNAEHSYIFGGGLKAGLPFFADQ